MNLSFAPVLVATSPLAGASLSPMARGSASQTGQLPTADLPAFALQEAVSARPACVAVPYTPSHPDAGLCWTHLQGTSAVAAKGECTVETWLVALFCVFARCILY